MSTETDCTFKETLKSCINSNIIEVEEDDHAVYLYLNDGQRISIYALEDGGFTIDVEPGTYH